jgi:hypothetical protein
VQHRLGDLPDAGHGDPIPLLDGERMTGRFKLDERPLPTGCVCTRVLRFTVVGA